MKVKAILSSLAAALLAVSTVAAGQALDGEPVSATYTFNTLSGATLGGHPVSATATFQTSAGQLLLTLTNNAANPVSIIQAISDISFTASGVTGGDGLKTPTVAPLITIGTDTTPLSGSPQWMLTSSGNDYHLDALAGPATGPATLIIGPGPYTNANGSIEDNRPHNPFINTSATFALALTGVTAATVISNVVFSFGTSGSEVVVPIPAAIWLFGSGLLGLIAVARRSRERMLAGPLVAV